MTDEHEKTPERMVLVVSTGATAAGDWTHAGAVVPDGEMVEVTEVQAVVLEKAGHATRV